jgi:hypothetical protein
MTFAALCLENLLEITLRQAQDDFSLDARIGRLFLDDSLACTALLFRLAVKMATNHVPSLHLNHHRVYL